MKLTRDVADALAARILQKLASDRILARTAENFSWQGFHDVRTRARKSFTVPETSITPLMARTLYGISVLSQARRILVLGSYVGSALLWLAAPQIDKRPSAETYIYGVDIDQEAIRIAERNFRSLGSRIVRNFAFDALLVAEKLPKEFDLVLLDADDPKTRKDIYLPLLETVYPLVRPGGLILAHDIVFPKFRDSMEKYLRLVRNTKQFARTQTLVIDPYGLEVSQKSVLAK